jgi:cytoskeletal protein RodZ
MNAYEFFEKYSIETINKKTRISPISLRFIKNKKFEKIPRVKFIGFVRIIEKEFNVNLSELIEEYNQTTNSKEEEKEDIKIEKPKNNTFWVFLLALILLIIGSYLLYKKYNNKKVPIIKKTYLIEPLNETTANKNSSLKSINISVIDKNETIKEINNTIKKTKKEIQQPISPVNIKIIPNEKVWFKAKNIDTNKTVEFLTSNPKTLEGANWYIKFGHGYITIKYGNETITPDTKKIVRILFRNGKYEYLKLHNRYEK